MLLRQEELRIRWLVFLFSLTSAMTVQLEQIREIQDSRRLFLIIGTVWLWAQLSRSNWESDPDWKLKSFPSTRLLHNVLPPVIRISWLKPFLTVPLLAVATAFTMAPSPRGAKLALILTLRVHSNCINITHYKLLWEILAYITVKLFVNNSIHTSICNFYNKFASAFDSTWLSSSRL